MKYGLSDTTIQSICNVLARYPQVERAILYGSRAKGTYKNGSDIDLSLQGTRELTLDVLYRILNDIDDLQLPYTVDLSLFEDIHDPALLDHIRRRGQVFYEKEQEKLTPLAQESAG